jgi:hypothetical protein
MNIPCSSWLSLLAVNPDDFRVWGRFDNQRAAGFGTAEWCVLIGGVTLLLAILGTSYVLAKRKGCEFLRNSPKGLFHDLCRAHRLHTRNRRLLKQLAAARGVPNPAELFVEPKYFDAADLPQSLQSASSELRQLRHALFDS